MRQVIICWILIFVFIQIAFAVENSCQQEITIRFIPFDKAELKSDTIIVVQIPTSNISLAPVELIKEGSALLKLDRKYTSLYLGKLTAELDKDYGLGLICQASCDSVDDTNKSKHKWKKLNINASNMLSRLKNGSNDNIISYGISISDIKILPSDKIVTVIWTIIDDENLYNHALLTRGFYSYEEFDNTIDNPQNLMQSQFGHLVPNIIRKHIAPISQLINTQTPVVR